MNHLYVASRGIDFAHSIGSKLARMGLLFGLAGLFACGCTNNPRGQNAQGVSLFQQGSIDAAEAMFVQARAGDPNNPHILYNLGRVAHHRAIQRSDLQQAQQAETFYNQCLTYDANHREANRAAAVLLVESNKTEDAFKLLQGWANRSPTSADARIELARLHEEFNERADAKEKLLQALLLEPTNPRALAALGRIREQEGDLLQAANDYQRSLWSDRNQPEVAARVANLKSRGIMSVPPAMTVPGSAPNNRTAPVVR